MIASWSLIRYLLDNWPMNLLDFLIVFMSDAIFAIELVAPSIFNLTVFRLVRIMRALRLISRFPRLRSLVRKAVASFTNILHVLFVLVFWHVLSALLGMQIFACSARNEVECALDANGSCPYGCSLQSVGKDPCATTTTMSFLTTAPGTSMSTSTPSGPPFARSSSLRQVTCL
jgi:hypothetical protein